MRQIKYIHDQGPDYHLKVKARVDDRRAAKQAEARERLQAQEQAHAQSVLQAEANGNCC